MYTQYTDCLYVCKYTLCKESTVPDRIINSAVLDLFYFYKQDTRKIQLLHRYIQIFIITST